MNRTDRTIEWLKNKKTVSIIIIVAAVITGIGTAIEKGTVISEFLKPVTNLFKSEKEYPVIPVTEAEGIVKNLLLEKPDFVRAQNLYGQNFIVAYTRHNNSFSLFKDQGSFWEKIQRIDSLDAIYNNSLHEEWEFVVIDSCPTLYFNYHSYGTFMGSAGFELIVFKSDTSYDLYSVTMSGSWKGEDGKDKFDNTTLSVERNSHAKRNNSFTHYLEKKLKDADMVNTPKPEDYNLDDPRNAETAWYVENNQQRTEEEESNLKNNETIRFKYFKEDLTQYQGDGSFTKQENNDYIFYDYFKSSCIIYDKQKEVYFIAYTHPNLNIQKIYLRKDNLDFTEGSLLDPPFIINLKTGKLNYY